MSGGPHYFGKSLVIGIAVHHNFMVMVMNLYNGSVHQMLCTKMEIFQLTPRRMCVFDMHDELSKFYICSAHWNGYHHLLTIFTWS